MQIIDKNNYYLSWFHFFNIIKPAILTGMGRLFFLYPEYILFGRKKKTVTPITQTSGKLLSTLELWTLDCITNMTNVSLTPLCRSLCMGYLLVKHSPLCSILFFSLFYLVLNPPQLIANVFYTGVVHIFLQCVMSISTTRAKNHRV